MSGYYTLGQLAQRVKLSATEIGRLLQEGLLEPTIKNGRTFLSSKQVYRLQAGRCDSSAPVALSTRVVAVSENYLQLRSFHPP